MSTSSKHRRELWAGLAFLAPNILGFAAFTLLPLLLSLALAFTNWDLRFHNLFKDERVVFVGLENFVRLFRERDFLRYFGNTLFLMLGIPLSIGGSLGAALLISRDTRGGGGRVFGWLLGSALLLSGAAVLAAMGAQRSAFTVLLTGLGGLILVGGLAGGPLVYRTLFYLPHFASGVAVYILWAKLYSPTGPINQVLEPILAPLGFRPPAWLADYRWAKPAIMFMALWGSIGSNNMLLYLAGLSNVPQDLYDAAAIDGASGVRRFRHVTWPQLAPVTFFIFIMSVINGLQGGFEMARVMTQGGPAGATTTLSYFIYTEGFETGRLGYASAVAWALFALVFAVTLVNLKFGRDRIDV
jgi:multiple sugar transport system permease protein